MAADFQNFKKRSEKEKSDIYAHANKEIALDMLEVIDSFEIALSHKDSVEKNFVSGMEKILKTTAPAPSSARCTADDRSEERRVGKECRSRWSPYH